MNSLGDYREQVLSAITKIPLDKLAQAIDWFREACDNDRQIFVCGNGGSAATASHFVADMVKGASARRPKRFRIQCLSDSVPTITAYANDVSYEVVFAEHLKNFAGAEDLVMAISGSGNSPNVIRAVECANAIGCRTLALTGRDGGSLGKLAGINLQVSEPHMGRIEDTHLIMCHMICYHFMEREALGPDREI